MLTRTDLRGHTEPPGPARVASLRAELPKHDVASDRPVEQVRQIIEAVRTQGDSALRKMTKEFDFADIDDFRVPQVAIENALGEIPPLLREALEEVHQAVVSYQRSVRPLDTTYERDGVAVREVFRPVESAGCYVPGGRAEYPSSVLMTAIPARVSGVERVILCVPPNEDGTLPDSVLAAAAIAQVDEVYTVGGAQAIAAMAYGTESIVPVDVIAGPGNVYVATAQSEVSGKVGVASSFAGPSEVMVIFDEMTPSEYAAIDILVQAEHGPHGAAWLVTWSEEAAESVEDTIATLVSRSSRREHVEKSLAEGGHIILVDDPQAAVDVANAVAPQHLQLMTLDPEILVPQIRHAGVILSGVQAPASAADYIAGPSSVLPVFGSARFSSALGVRDFMRLQHVIAMDDASLARVSPHVAALAEAEGLEARASSVLMRSRL